MGEHFQDEPPEAGERPSAFDTALWLAARQSELVDTTRATMAASHERRSALLGVLRHQVVSYTRLLRNEGVPPERVLALVKAAVSPALTTTTEDRRDVMESVVRWCVGAYFAT